MVHPQASMKGQDFGSSPCRELTIKEMLTRKADEYRREALRLETLSAQYPEGYIQPDAEATLRFLVGATLNR